MKNRFVRLFLFGLFMGAVIYYLSDFVARNSAPVGDVVSDQQELNTNGDVLGNFSRQVMKAVPPGVKEKLGQAEKEVSQQAVELVEKNQAVSRVDSVVKEVTRQATDFSEEQKKEIKKKVVKEVCNQLIKKIENE